MPDPTAPDRQAVRDQLDRLRRSAAFLGSEKLFAFLQFAVEETLAANGLRLKEGVIGNAVYGRDPPYDPRIDSTVRVEARRLRRKLAEYYQGAGRSDPVIIDLPVGGYTPRIGHNPIVLPRGARDPDGVAQTLAILPFRAHSAREDDAQFADGLTDELIFLAAQSPGLRVAPRLAVFQYRDQVVAAATLARALQAQTLVHGSVRWDGTRVRLTLETTDASGYVTWSDRLDAAGEDRLRLQEELADEAWRRLEGHLERPLDGALPAFPARLAS